MSNILTNNINPRSGNKITIGGVNDTVSISGTVTYEDVTSVDSVGVITARQGVVIGTGASIGNPANNELGLYTNSSERVRIDSSGRIGIGVSTPDREFHVESSLADTQYQPVARFETSSTGDFGPAIELTGNRNSNVSTAWIGIDSVSAGGSNLVYASDGSHRWLGNDKASERMRIDTSGRLLVGTSSAINSGYAGGSIQLRDNAGGTIVFKRNDGTDTNGLGILEFHSSFGRAALIEVSNDGTHSGSSTPGAIKFQTTSAGTFNTPTERMRIMNNGRLLAFTSSTDGHGFRSSQAASTSHILIGGLRDASSTTSGTFVFVVRTNGQVENSANSYGALSDAKLKENIVDANPQWNDIKRLQVRRFNFIEGDTHTQIGLIAQEVESISPGLVSESVDKDENGNDLETTTKSIKYSVLYMKAVKALQEAMERIETLEAKVAVLEGN